MSAEHRKPVVAFILLAFLATGVIGLQRAEAGQGRLLAAAAGVGAQVSGTLPVLDDEERTAAAERTLALGPAFAALSGDAHTVSVMADAVAATQPADQGASASVTAPPPVATAPAPSTAGPLATRTATPSSVKTRRAPSVATTAEKSLTKTRDKTRDKSRDKTRAERRDKPGKGYAYGHDKRDRSERGRSAAVRQDEAYRDQAPRGKARGHHKDRRDQADRDRTPRGKARGHHKDRGHRGR